MISEESSSERRVRYQRAKMVDKQLINWFFNEQDIVQDSFDFLSYKLNETFDEWWDRINNEIQKIVDNEF